MVKMDFWQIYDYRAVLIFWIIAIEIDEPVVKRAAVFVIITIILMFIVVVLIVAVEYFTSHLLF